MDVDKKATVSLILGVISLLLGWIPLLGYIIIGFSLYYGISAVRNNTAKKGFAIAGIILSSISILIVFATLPLIGALAYFGVLNPDNFLPERTVYQHPLSNIENAILDSQTNTIEISFINNAGHAIVLTGDGEGSSIEGGTCFFEDAYIPGQQEPITTSTNIEEATQVENGDIFRVVWECNEETNTNKEQRFNSENLGFEYINTNSESTTTHSGTVQSTWN